MNEIPDIATGSAIAAAAQFGGNQPKTLSVVHYGRDGISVASTGQAALGLLVGEGATIHYTSKRAGGAPLASSSVIIDGGGCARSAQTEFFNPDGSPRCKVQADYAGVVYNAAGGVASGSAQFATFSSEGDQTHSASMAYTGESYAGYSLDLVKPAQPGSMQRLDIAFNKAVVSGLRVIGGELGITRYNSDGLPVSQSTSQLTDQGVPQALITYCFGANGTSPAVVIRSDYSAVRFDARGRIDTGDLVVVYEPAGSKTSVARLFRFANGVLINRWSFVPGTPGAPVAQAPPAPASKPIAQPWQPTRGADRTSIITRDNGTLIERREDWFVQGSTSVPWRSQVSGYAIDGATAIRLTDIDYRAALFGATGEPVGGTVISTRFDGGVRSSTSNLIY